MKGRKDMENSTRLLFGKPIRKETTEEFYPDKMSFNQFVYELSIDTFIKNIRDLPALKDKELYIEEWAEILLAWHEIEPDKYLKSLKYDDVPQYFVNKEDK